MKTNITDYHDYPYDLGVKVQGQLCYELESRSVQNNIKICHKPRNANSYIFFKCVTMIDYGVYITTQISDHIYEIEIKGQGQIYLKSVLQLVHFLS